MEGSPEKVQVCAFPPGAKGRVHDDCVCPQPTLLPERAHIASHKFHLQVASSSHWLPQGLLRASRASADHLAIVIKSQTIQQMSSAPAGAGEMHRKILKGLHVGLCRLDRV